MSVRINLKQILIITFVVIVFIIIFVSISSMSAIDRDVPLQTIEYVIDPNIQGIEKGRLTNAMSHATLMWAESNPGLKFVMVENQDALQITTDRPWFIDVAEIISNDPSYFIDGHVSCSIWDTDASDCTLYIDQSRIKEYSKDWNFECEAKWTIAHELGHVLGLSHYPASKKENLMGSPAIGQAKATFDTKGYVIPENFTCP